ncbi:MAG: hypothetical protein ACYTKD_09055 [Planctomycetota bacterium]
MSAGTERPDLRLSRLDVPGRGAPPFASSGDGAFTVSEDGSAGAGAAGVVVVRGVSGVGDAAPGSGPSGGGATSAELSGGRLAV